MPKLSVGQYAKILYETTRGLNKTEMEPVIQAFVNLVIENQMKKKLPYIIEKFESLSKKMDGVVEMEVTSAHALSNVIQKQVEETFGGKVEMKLKEDPSLIGGVTIKTENKIFDASIKTQLLKMKEQLS